MTDRIIHGFTEAEIEALKIRYEYQNQCLKYIIPYKRCFLKQGFLSEIMSDINECSDLKRDATQCQRMIFLRDSGLGPIKMKKSDPDGFESKKVSPSLSNNYRPNILDRKIGGH